MGDKNEQVAYLRSKSLNYLTQACANAFLEHEAALLAGSLQQPLIELIPSHLLKPLQTIEEISVQEIYNHASVVEIELAGYEVMDYLLGRLVPVLVKQKDQRNARDKKMVRLIPEQYKTGIDAPTAYERVQCAIDYVAGMTDLYAMELYRKWKGISIPGF
jgi:dGTPase